MSHRLTLLAPATIGLAAGPVLPLATVGMFGLYNPGGASIVGASGVLLFALTLPIRMVSRSFARRR